MKIPVLVPSMVVLATLAVTVHSQCPPLGTPSPDLLVAPGLGLKAGDEFGRAVAISGDVAVVGAWLQDVFVPGDNVGAAYVYEREQGCWVLKQQLIVPVGVESCRAVAVSGDRILLANWKEFSPSLGSTGPGAVYVFEKDPSGCWGVTAKLQPSPGSGDGFDLFGVSLALEGDRALIGAREDNSAGLDEGAVYVFDYDSVNDVWTETQKILPPSGASVLPGWFGNSVSLSGDRALIGKWVTTCEPPPSACMPCINFNCGDTCDCDTGEAFVYDRSPAGQWTLSATLTASDAAPGDGFGAVALSGDTAVVGAYEDDAGCSGSPLNCNSGSAYVFERGLAGNWNQTAKLVPSDSEALDNFGISVSVAGTTIVVGARYWDEFTQDVGTAYVFAKQGSTWTEIHNLTAPGAKPGARVGFSTSLSEDGRFALLGAIQDNGASLGTGAAYVLGTSLSADRGLASLSSGDVVNFSLWAGQEPGSANQIYILLGSLSGSCPGVQFDGEFLPLNVTDSYFLYTLGSPNAPPLSQSLGTLDAAAQATAAFTVPAGANPNLTGLVLHHAYVLLDTTTIPGAALVGFASNAVQFQLVP